MAPTPIKTVTLYSGPLSMYGAKAEIAALEQGLPVLVVMVPFTDQHRYEAKHPEVMGINPKHQVLPVLVHGAVQIFDSTQILECFEDLQPDPRLWPLERAARAEARLRELKSDEVFFSHVIRLMGLQERQDAPVAQEAITALHRYYKDMDTLRAERGHLAGDYSYADIAFFMAQLFPARLGAPMGRKTPRLLRWRMRIARRPAARRVIKRLTETLTWQNRPVPDFLHEALEQRNG